MNADPVQLNSAIEAQILQMQIMADQYTKLQKSCELWVLYHMLTSHAEIATFLKIRIEIIIKTLGTTVGHSRHPIWPDLSDHS